MPVQSRKRRRTERELLHIASQLQIGWTEGDRIMPHLRRLLPTIDRLVNTEDLAIADIALALDRAGISYSTGAPWQAKILRKRLSEIRTANREQGQSSQSRRKPVPKSTLTRPATVAAPPAGQPMSPASGGGVPPPGPPPAQARAASLPWPPSDPAPSPDHPTRVPGPSERSYASRDVAAPPAPVSLPAPPEPAVSTAWNDEETENADWRPPQPQPSDRPKVRYARPKPRPGPATAPLRSYREPGEPLPDWLYPPRSLPDGTDTQPTPEDQPDNSPDTSDS